MRLGARTRAVLCKDLDHWVCASSLELCSSRTFWKWKCSLTAPSFLRGFVGNHGEARGQNKGCPYQRVCGEQGPYQTGGPAWVLNNGRVSQIVEGVIKKIVGGCVSDV